MVFIKRDPQGGIISISKEKDEEHTEVLSGDNAEVNQFLNNESSLLENNGQMSPVIEELINLLIDKHVITFTELPQAVQEKLIDHQGLRHRLPKMSANDQSPY